MVTEEAEIVVTEIDVEAIDGGEIDAEATGVPTVMEIEGLGGDKSENKDNRA